MPVKYGRYEDRQERKMVVRTPEEDTQDAAADAAAELILGQVCLSDPGKFVRRSKISHLMGMKVKHCYCVVILRLSHRMFCFGC